MFVKQAFEGEYPKLLRLYNDLWKRLQQFNISMTVPVSSFEVTAVEDLRKPDSYPQAKSDGKTYEWVLHSVCLSVSV